MVAGGSKEQQKVEVLSPEQWKARTQVRGQIEALGAPVRADGLRPQEMLMVGKLIGAASTSYPMSDEAFRTASSPECLT